MKKYSFVTLYTAIVLFILFIYLVVGSWLINVLYDGARPPDNVLLVVSIIWLLIGGSPGLLNISKKEAASQIIHLPIKGRRAVFIGVVWISVFYGAIIFLVLKSIF